MVAALIAAAPAAFKTDTMPDDGDDDAATAADEAARAAEEAAVNTEESNEENLEDEGRAKK